jgi:hypothetical protein
MWWGRMSVANLPLHWICSELHDNPVSRNVDTGLQFTVKDSLSLVVNFPKTILSHPLWRGINNALSCIIGSITILTGRL